MSNDKDIVVGSTVMIPMGPPTKMVPSYLIKLLPDQVNKKKTYEMFLAVEQPQFNPDFIHAKGFFTTATEDDIVTGYKEMIASASASEIMEMWLPWHSVHSVRSLVFKTANKR